MVRSGVEGQQQRECDEGVEIEWKEGKKETECRRGDEKIEKRKGRLISFWLAYQWLCGICVISALLLINSIGF